MSSTFSQLHCIVYIYHIPALFSSTGYSPHRLTRNTENTQSCPQMEVLRGRDGRDGRDGEKGHKGDMGQPGPQGEQGPQGPPTGGTTYIRWGRTTCPSGHNTTLVYSGRAGGTHYLQKGGIANYLCMPDDPDHLQYLSGTQGYSYIAGVEYYYHTFPSLSAVNSHNVPCALCYVSTRSVAVIIPAKTHCPTNWTLEYTGYLMAESHNHYRTMYECVDKNPESVPGSNGWSGARAGIYLVEPYCNGLSCPPYDAEKELTCALCTC